MDTDLISVDPALIPKFIHLTCSITHLNMCETAPLDLSCKPNTQDAPKSKTRSDFSVKAILAKNIEKNCRSPNPEMQEISSSECIDKDSCECEDLEIDVETVDTGDNVQMSPESDDSEKVQTPSALPSSINDGHGILLPTAMNGLSPEVGALAALASAYGLTASNLWQIPPQRSLISLKPPSDTPLMTSYSNEPSDCLKEWKASDFNLKKCTRFRKQRTPFSPMQIKTLEMMYQKSKYLSGADKAEISHKLDLTERQVKIWFQNRRSKSRRQEQAMFEKNQLNAISAAISAANSICSAGNNLSNFQQHPTQLYSCKKDRSTNTIPAPSTSAFLSELSKPKNNLERFCSKSVSPISSSAIPAP